MLLSDPRVDVNIGTRTGRETALMLAMRENNYDMVKLLLSHENIDLNTKDFYGRTALEYALKSKCSDDIVVTLWSNIEKRIGNGTLENHTIILEQDSEIEERSDRLKKDYRINLRPIVEFTYSESESEESDVSEESEILENQEPATLEHQETEPEPEISEIEVEAGPSAKRPRLG